MKHGRRAGFSFIELAASLAIMATLLLIAVPTAMTVTQRHQEAELRTALITLRQAIDAYKKDADHGRIAVAAGASGYPPDLDALVEGVDDISTPERRKIYYLRRVPADPFFTGSESEPTLTWGLRSYQSPPDEPAAGDDVFDVYSTSAATGLNGVPYRDW